MQQEISKNLLTTHVAGEGKQSNQKPVSCQSNEGKFSSDTTP